MKHLLFAASIVLFTGAIAKADVNPGGSLALTGQVEGSIALYMFSDPGGYTFSVDGLANESMDMGTISAYSSNGLQANKFTKGIDSDGFHVSTPFLLQVVKANVPSSSYALTAQLGDNDSSVWKVDGIVLSTAPVPIALTEPYDSKQQHTVYAKFPFSRPAGAVLDTITFTVTAN